MGENIFEKIKKINKQAKEFWGARELAKVLDYNDFRNFENAINKAKISCEQSGQKIKDNFGDVTESIESGKGATRNFKSWELSR